MPNVAEAQAFGCWGRCQFLREVRARRIENGRQGSRVKWVEMNFWDARLGGKVEPQGREAWEYLYTLGGRGPELVLSCGKGLRQRERRKRSGGWGDRRWFMERWSQKTGDSEGHEEGSFMDWNGRSFTKTEKRQRGGFQSRWIGMLKRVRARYPAWT